MSFNPLVGRPESNRRDRVAHGGGAVPPASRSWSPPRVGALPGSADSQPTAPPGWVRCQARGGPVGTRGAIRTRNLRDLNAAPLPFGLLGHVSFWINVKHDGAWQMIRMMNLIWVSVS